MQNQIYFIDDAVFGYILSLTRQRRYPVYRRSEHNLTRDEKRDILGASWLPTLIGAAAQPNGR